jgi:hypothetical protein
MALKRSHPEPMLVTLMPQVDEASLPKSFEELEKRVSASERRAERKLELFREGLKAYAARWAQDTAKQVAVSQNEHTLRMGRRGVHTLKQRIEELATTFPRRIDREFTHEYLQTGDVSSGQVPLLIDRKFQHGIRSLLGELFPLISRAGYQRDRHWFDADSGSLELPADLRMLLDEMVEALAETKVCQAKMRYFDQQSRKQAAERLWDGS